MREIWFPMPSSCDRGRGAGPWTRRTRAIRGNAPAVCRGRAHSKRALRGAKTPNFERDGANPAELPAKSTPGNIRSGGQGVGRRNGGDNLLQYFAIFDPMWRIDPNSAKYAILGRLLEAHIIQSYSIGLCRDYTNDFDGPIFRA